MYTCFVYFVIMLTRPIYHIFSQQAGPRGRSGPEPLRAHAVQLLVGAGLGRLIYFAMLYYTILYYTILYYTILYCTILLAGAGLSCKGEQMSL